MGENGVFEGDKKGAENDFEAESGEVVDDDVGVHLVRGSSEVLKMRRGLFIPHHTLRAATCFFSRFPLYDNTVIPY